jgi:hypothetical protein
VELQVIFFLIFFYILPSFFVNLIISVIFFLKPAFHSVSEYRKDYTWKLAITESSLPKALLRNVLFSTLLQAWLGLAVRHVQLACYYFQITSTSSYPTPWPQASCPSADFTLPTLNTRVIVPVVLLQSLRTKHWAHLSFHCSKFPCCTVHQPLTSMSSSFGPTPEMTL